MRVRRVSISNFRGISSGNVLLDSHSLLVGGNAAGKSTVCEALELVLGLERLYRRPVIDEYDFHRTHYRAADDSTEPTEVRIEVVLTDLSEEARRRFRGHLRPWSSDNNDFAPPAAEDAVDLVEGEWCLPVVFLGRFNAADDDFEGGTFFAHPRRPEGDYAEDDLGGALSPFRRDDKRYCGFLYLRPNRTGNRALSFGRGSLIDTIVRLESDRTGSLWTSALDALGEIDLAESTSAFSEIRAAVLSRVRNFLSMPASDSAIGVRPSDLTREHLREVLRMFIATQPGTYPVPFNRLSTGALNVLVFALLTYIADLRGPDSVIFAMEEPEIALPPHTQRRLVDFVTGTMGQAIVTSHSPYVIERFDPSQIVVLKRDDDGVLTSKPIELGNELKPKRYRQERRQFAEAVLARGVLVVEGATEVVTLLAIADALDADPATTYQHPDVAGLSLFNAGSDTNVPHYGPIFSAMGKTVFGVHDTPNTPLTPEQDTNTQSFAIHIDVGYPGIEDLLVTEIPPAVQRNFLTSVSTRSDYPAQCGQLPEQASDEQARDLAREVLKKRKGTESFAPLLIAECSRGELPTTLVTLLLDIHQHLSPLPHAENPPPPEDAPQSNDLGDA
ncbi:putative ATP-dependent endonuclease of the OLD family [Saccharomonospora marina XMU15]|uniref:Putative ATP-dependent endonuclease of the OLD family n=1 Tax=Saccharomonospora marina XMU15 TaxID=882083 RepID=H5X610_9PSEU|nr:AAA family ATPase [Saccharomonospora marina]EHR53409.1 putative ATP-dependent endonuclease of the OLD family [Saccharomonospora marina XMU15]